MAIYVKSPQFVAINIIYTGLLREFRPELSCNQNAAVNLMIVSNTKQFQSIFVTQYMHM